MRVTFTLERCCHFLCEGRRVEVLKGAPSRRASAWRSHIETESKVRYGAWHHAGKVPRVDRASTRVHDRTEPSRAGEEDVNDALVQLYICGDEDRTGG